MGGRTLKLKKNVKDTRSLKIEQILKLFLQDKQCLKSEILLLQFLSLIPNIIGR